MRVLVITLGLLAVFGSGIALGTYGFIYLARDYLDEERYTYGYVETASTLKYLAVYLGRENQKGLRCDIALHAKMLAESLRDDQEPKDSFVTDVINEALYYYETEVPQTDWEACRKEKRQASAE